MIPPDPHNQAGEKNPVSSCHPIPDSHRNDVTPQLQKNSQKECEIKYVFQFLEFLDIHFPSINAEATMTLRCFRKLAISTACVAMRIFGSFFSFPCLTSRPAEFSLDPNCFSGIQKENVVLPNFFPTRGACTSYPESSAVGRDFDPGAQSCKSDISTPLITV